MKKLLILAAICCFTGIIASCELNNLDTDEPTEETQGTNPVAGTSWVWTEAPITWTFTFTEKEVTLDYRAEFSPTDITTAQYKSTYKYENHKVFFDMKGWSEIIWQFTGKIDGNTMELTDSGIEKISIVLTKK